MKSTAARILFVYLVTFFQSCNTKRCYHCISSFDEPGCGNIVDDEYLQDCPENMECHALVLGYRTPSWEQIIIRTCELKGIRYEVESCSTDKCNRNDAVANTNNTSADTKIKCYTCDSSKTRPNPRCIKIVDNQRLKNCKIGEECGTTKEFINETLQHVSRGCVPMGMKIEYQLNCDIDKCNGDIVTSTKNERAFNLLKMFKYGFN